MDEYNTSQPDNVHLQLHDELSALRSASLFREEFYSIGKAVVSGFELTLLDPFGDPFGPFRITSVGVVCLTILNGEVYVPLVKEANGRIDIPSGKVEEFDKSPCASAKREFREEVGNTLEDIVPLDYITNIKKNTASLQYLGVAKLDDLHVLAIRDEIIVASPKNEVDPDTLGILFQKFEDFRDPHKTLLKHSHHPQAYRLMYRAIEEKLRYVNEAGKQLF